MCKRELETEQNCNILTPTLMAISVYFPFSWAAQPGTWGPSLSVPQSSIFSPTGLISKLSIGGLETPSAGCWLFLPHLVSNWSDLQTDWISCALSYIIVQRTPSSCGRHKLHSFNPYTVKFILCYSSTGCTCYLHWCFSYFDSPAGS